MYTYKEIDGEVSVLDKRESGHFQNASSSLAAQVHPAQSVFNIVLQKSFPSQIRQLILYYYVYKEFVCELTFAKRL